jgi:hypothetical protein
MNIRWTLAALLVMTGIAHAQGFQSTNVDCANLKLKDATGVGDPAAMQHDYDFSGTCVLSIKGDGYVKTIKTFPVEASGRWDVKEKQFEETVQVLGAFKWDGKVIGGQMTSAFKCNDDPLVANAACNGFDHKNKTSLEALSNSYKQQGRPLLVGHTTPAAALALSSKHPKGYTGPKAEVPPPKKVPPGLKSTSDLNVAPHVTIRSPKAGQVLSGGAVHLDVAGTSSLIHKYAVDAVLLEWQWADTPKSIPGRPLWKSKRLLGILKWSGQEGPIYFAAIDIPFAQFPESSKWRVRARPAYGAIKPTEWREFSVIPLNNVPPT